MSGKSVVVTPNGEQFAFSNRLGGLGVKMFRGGQWEPWVNLGGSIQGEPQATSWRDGHADVYVRWSDNTVRHRYYNAGTWSAWEQVGLWHVTSDPTPIAWANGRVDIFARGTDWSLIHAWYQDGYGWGGWEGLGGGLNGQPSAVSWGASHLDIFVRGTDDKLYHRWFGPGGWAQFEQLGHWQMASDPVATSWGSGHLDVFARGYDDSLIHNYYDNSSWHGWSGLGGGTTGKPSAITFGWGHLDVYMRGSDGRVYHRWFDGSQWRGWEGLSTLGVATTPNIAVVSRNAGHIDAFGYNAGQLVHRWYLDPTGWRAWEELNAPATPTQYARIAALQSNPAGGQALVDESATDPALGEALNANATEESVVSDGPEYAVQAAVGETCSPRGRKIKSRRYVRWTKVTTAWREANVEYWCWKDGKITRSKVSNTSWIVSGGCWTDVSAQDVWTIPFSRKKYVSQGKVGIIGKVVPCIPYYTVAPRVSYEAGGGWATYYKDPDLS